MHRQSVIPRRHLSRFSFETLEVRTLLAGMVGGELVDPAFQNPNNPLDANADGAVTVNEDLGLILQKLSQFGEIDLHEMALPESNCFVDFNGDGRLDAGDVRGWIDRFLHPPAGEGEPTAPPPPALLLPLDIQDETEGLPASPQLEVRAAADRSVFEQELLFGSESRAENPYVQLYGASGSGGKYLVQKPELPLGVQEEWLLVVDELLQDLAELVDTDSSEFKEKWFNLGAALKTQSAGLIDFVFGQSDDRIEELPEPSDRSQQPDEKNEESRANNAPQVENNQDAPAAANEEPALDPATQNKTGANTTDKQRRSPVAVAV